MRRRQVHDTVWGWLLPAAVLPPHFPHFGGLLACEEDSGAAIGLAHYRSSLDTLSGVQTGFLHDLYVQPDARGQGAGALLLQSVAALGNKEGWSKIEWMTANDNHAGQRL
jgi:GNAT superfamily N-acetyltransferase